ncbi:hypothetical protein G8S49_05770 [Clostridium botulinum C]|uniref:Uncharacterized protein n=2 Tax=Clostridium botulinum TaxID=1491 RepID=A0A9Q4Y0W8_CLOBO|nr:hypothetical protein [Clostridium botulinum]YP_398527.1 hypothetical protein CST097 [Clostridium phage c-st]MCD3194859.1 hypothetical protein [Clostridium botulinum C]MCD3200206.1 hypothetical protein [Clostridium botulinum C]MCD3205727.1 hypothetical protein [Clostridium botulinum C]MCD3207438.1 hypothetical protein [Clostridium botulinum C]MCD3226172.1 hypothetical protein [Clostridium botulinum C]
MRKFIKQIKFNIYLLSMLNLNMKLLNIIHKLSKNNILPLPSTGTQILETALDISNQITSLYKEMEGIYKNQYNK